MKGRLLALLVCLLASPTPTPALAWSDVGHRIICEIAFQELNDTAREPVKALIVGDPEFDTFAEACSWPDHPRRRPEEHYVNLPRHADRLEQDPCPLATDCVVSAIAKDLTVLSSSSASKQQRLEALKYLGHWVGDIHQPLHVSFEDDRGGNSIGVSGGLCSWNLHSVWDGCLIEEVLPGDPEMLARQLLAEVTDDERVAWQDLGPDRLGERVVRDLDQPRGRVLRASRCGMLVRRRQRAPRPGRARESGHRRSGPISRPRRRSLQTSWSRRASGSRPC